MTGSPSDTTLAGRACPFCTNSDWLFEDKLVRAVWDRYPVSPGHALIVPRRHFSNWFEATDEERAALMAGTDRVRLEIEKSYEPAGFNIGVNSGEAAGQTVSHLHLHVIPRYVGDVADPRGGIRHVIPSKANYLASTTKALHSGSSLIGGADDPLLAHLLQQIDKATNVDVAVAFVLDSGVRLLEEHLRDVLGRGGQIRFLTGDYFGITEPDALLRLLDLGLGADIRIFESAGTSFHPKGYIMHSQAGGTAFVGSSNISQTALQTGVEWNYRVIKSLESEGFNNVCKAFEALFLGPKTTAVTPEWIERYRARRQPIPPVMVGVPLEPPPPPPKPHSVQLEALSSLAATRAVGNAAGLVVLATGLGKTWLSAFDTENARAQRVLFVAHREEILDQAIRTFRAIRPHAVLGKYTGTEKTPLADVVFASIQTLGRAKHLNAFAPEFFDYIVVDEFHHAAASTYRRLIDYFTPKFLLGLTATPERTDGADLLALCGENLVYRCDLAEGIRRGLLSPFDYYGVPDEVNYENIPWRSHRFDEEALTTAVATESRAENALDQLKRRGGKRVLAFCVSQRHADYMNRFFDSKGLRSASVHSGEGSDPRAHSLEALQLGEIDVLCAVDMFNEGVDIPDVDTILMLRPTESQIVWLQQFGRGLRVREGKRLKVIDYIGNHRSFLLKPRTLFQLEPGDAEISRALKLISEGRGDELLPPGCSVTYDLEAKEILLSLLGRPATREALVAYYTDFRERTGYRPSASETFHDGLDPKSARREYGSWFQFVRTMADLSPQADQAEVRLRTFLTALEVTPMTKSFKMLVLLAMIAEGKMPGAIGIQDLMKRIRVIAIRSATLRTELGDGMTDDAALERLLEENPIGAWTEGRGTAGESFFRYENNILTTTFSVDAPLAGAASDLIREIADWRLAVYLRRVGVAGAPRILCKVSHSNGRPLLFLPPRDRTPGVPEGWVEVTADGEAYHANFAKIAVNVLTRGESQENRLPELLHKWFGDNAGQPGTSQAVVFEYGGDGYILAPAGNESGRGPQLWKAYKRAEVPKLFGFEFSGFENQLGIVVRPGIVLLFVTLEKKDMQESHRYEESFLSPSEFRWQSQNRTTRASDVGQLLQHHVETNTQIHLFVRAAPKERGKTLPFTYCGELAFEKWEGDNPITVWWRLRVPVPANLRGDLKVPADG